MTVTKYCVTAVRFNDARSDGIMASQPRGMQGSAPFFPFFGRRAGMQPKSLSHFSFKGVAAAPGDAQRAQRKLAVTTRHRHGCGIMAQYRRRSHCASGGPGSGPRGLFDPGFFVLYMNWQPQVGAGAKSRTLFFINMCINRLVLSSSAWAQFLSSLPFSFFSLWSSVSLALDS